MVNPEGETVMKRLGGMVLAASLLLAGRANAAPSTLHGNAALTVAALVGQYSPALSASQKHILYKFLAGVGTFPSSNAPIHFHVNAIQCQLGDVALTVHRCQITYGGVVTNENGEEGAAILANMALAGVLADGAAGTIHYGMTNINCTIDVAEVKSPTGGGVTCTYTP